MQAMWLLFAAALILVGGVMLVLLLGSFWRRPSGKRYLFFVAPRYFDVEEPPDAAAGSNRPTRSSCIARQRPSCCGPPTPADW